MSRSSEQVAKTATSVVVRLLRQDDLPTADAIFRSAFGTFLGMPDPTRFGGDSDAIRTRYLADPSAAFGAEVGGELAGSVFVTNWGSVGFFGPLTVRPDLWGQGVASLLLERVLETFATWGTTHTGLFTFADSTKHVHLYQKFGFWPRFLTMLMACPVGQAPAATSAPVFTRYSDLSNGEQGAILDASRDVTDAIYPGLDVRREITAVATQRLGETVLLTDDAGVEALAVCHCGPGTEAGSGVCYVKVGAVRPGPNASAAFDALLSACAALAAEKGLTRLVCGVNSARHDAYRQMLTRGFRVDFQGVVMERPNAPGYNRPDAYIIDDWR